jgi:hypothetical protein
MVRGEDKAKALANLGVNTLLFNGLDETDVLAKAASKHDSKLIISYALWLKSQKLIETYSRNTCCIWLPYALSKGTGVGTSPEKENDGQGSSLYPRKIK